jgi:hypothetical protein
MKFSNVVTLTVLVFLTILCVVLDHRTTDANRRARAAEMELQQLIQMEAVVVPCR